MTASTIWIRDNMLRTSDQYERQLTEAEVKVQKSLEKLSIPDWYLNKRSSPPKILRNVLPIGSRPSCWKNVATGSTLPSRHSVAYAAREKDGWNNNNNNNNSIVTRESGTKTFDRGSAKDTSQTFPKVSPSRRIRNINIVLPPIPRPNVNILSAPQVDAVDNGNGSRRKVDSSISILNGSFGTPNTTEISFKMPAASTPNSTPANLFSSTVIEDAAIIGQDQASRSFLDDFSILDKTRPNIPSSCFTERSYHFYDRNDCERENVVSRCLLDVSSVLESTETNISRSIRGNLAERKSKTNCQSLRSSVRSIDPILFEKDDNRILSLPPTSRFSLVREMVRRIDSNNESPALRAASKHDGKRDGDMDMDMDMDREREKRKTCRLDSRTKRLAVDDTGKKESKQYLSPCTRFLQSRKKSTQLENIVKSEQRLRGKGHVREIIQELNGKCRSLSTVEHTKPLAVAKNQNVVKSIVNALERGNDTLIHGKDTSTITTGTGRVGVGTNSCHRNDHASESCNESEFKTSACSSDVDVDVDSSSDCERRSQSLKSDEESRFDYEVVSEEESSAKARGNVNVNRLEEREEDSVYWIPVSSRCTLPRSSSLLSVMSKLSRAHSPCVSPIRSESETSETQLDDCPSHVWGATFDKRTSRPPAGSQSQKLFRIDETVVVDSGYSDKSDKSDKSDRCSNTSSGSSTPNATTCSEDEGNDSQSEIRSSRLARSRRKTILVQRRPSSWDFNC